MSRGQPSRPACRHRSCRAACSCAELVGGHHRLPVKPDRVSTGCERGACTGVGYSRMTLCGEPGLPLSTTASTILFIHSHRRNLGVQPTGTPTFRTEGNHSPTFQDEKVKNLLSPTVRGDLRSLNYNKTIFRPELRWESS